MSSQPRPPKDLLGAEIAVAEPRGSGALTRRLFTVPRTIVLFFVVTLLSPGLVAVACLVDAGRASLFRKPWVASRLTAFLWLYLFAEMVGLAALSFVWLQSGFGSRKVRLIDATYRVQEWWTGFLFGGMRRLFGLRFEIEGDACVTPGPIVVLVRHASIADTLLPSVFITRRHGIRLRFVLKRELLQDPCLDIAGLRIPNHFVARGSKESAEIEAVRALTRDLGAAEGVLIYPEGTRFTERKRGELIRRERESSAEKAPRMRAERFRHVLPPRLGGPLALLDGFTEADVVMVAHRGFEGFASPLDIWEGGLVGRTVSAKMWRIARSAIPAGREERIRWLEEQWSLVDAFVGAREEGSEKDGSGDVRR